MNKRCIELSLKIFILLLFIFKIKEGITNTMDTSGKYSGRFEVNINNNFIYKKTKNNKAGIKLKEQIKDEGFYKYKDIIENSYKIKHRHAVKGFNVKKDGSYNSIYIDGYRLDRIDYNIEHYILLKIKKQVRILIKDLDDNKEDLTGDWGLQNLVYSIKDDKIYNIDNEGFFTYDRINYKNSYKRWMEGLKNILKYK